MRQSAQSVAGEILDIIKRENIISYTNCQTRLRIHLRPNNDIDLEKLKTIKTVHGVLSPSVDEIQIILGPGWVQKVKDSLANLIANFDQSAIGENKTIHEIAFDVKNELKSKQNKIQLFLSKFSKIFAPMIIGFIGAGLLAGIAGILQSAYSEIIINDKGIKELVFYSNTAKSWFNFLNLSLNIWKNAFIIIIGWRTLEVFGGSGVLGALCAVIYVPSFASEVISPFITNGQEANFLGIPVSDPLYNWLTIGFRPSINNDNNLVLSYASGNILGALIAALTVYWLEKGIRKVVPNVLDTIVTPTLILFIMLFVNFLLLVPISGYLYTGVAWFFMHLYNNPFGAFVLATIFLTTVVFGIHQGFIPVYAILIEQTGVNGLFPILAMGGFSQIGAALALYFMSERKSALRKQIQGALVPAVFGIGEPLIYGVTLPRVRPFITTCLGAGFGGFFIGAVSMWGNYDIGLNSMFGPSGILASILMTTPDGKIGLAVSIYLIGALIALSSGLGITLFSYSKIVVYGTSQMKNIYTNNHTKINQVLYSLAFATIIGIIIYWLVKYFSLPSNERNMLKGKSLLAEV